MPCCQPPLLWECLEESLDPEQTQQPSLQTNKQSYKIQRCKYTHTHTNTNVLIPNAQGYKYLLSRKVLQNLFLPPLDCIHHQRYIWCSSLWRRRITTVTTVGNIKLYLDNSSTSWSLQNSFEFNVASLLHQKIIPSKWVCYIFLDHIVNFVLCICLHGFIVTNVPAARGLGKS